jgi:hypothetical protein
MHTLMIKDDDVTPIATLINQHPEIEKIYIKCDNVYNFDAQQINVSEFPYLKEIQINVPRDSAIPVIKILIQKSNHLEVLDIVGQNWLQAHSIHEDDVKNLTTLKALKLQQSYDDDMVVNSNNPILAKLIHQNAATLEILECPDVLNFDSYLDIDTLNRLTNLKVLVAQIPGAALAAIMQNNANTLEVLSTNNLLSMHPDNKEISKKINLLLATYFPKLTTINNNYAYDPRSLDILLNHAPELEELNLGRCRYLHLNDNKIFSLPKLKKFSATAISGQTLSVLLSKAAALEELTLKEPLVEKLEDGDLQALQELKFPQLKRLNFTSKINNDVPQAINSHALSLLLNNAPELEEINFDKCHDSNIQAIQSLNLTKLKKLSVRLASAQTFGALLRLFASQLEELDLRACSMINVQEIDIETAFHGIQFTKLKELKVNHIPYHYITGRILAAIINKAPQLHDNLPLLVNSLFMFTEYHKATGLIMKILMKNITQGMPIDKNDMEKVLTSKALPIKKLAFFQAWFDRANPQIIQETLEKPGECLNLYINIVINKITHDECFYIGQIDIEQICARADVVAERILVLLREWFKRVDDLTIQKILRKPRVYATINNIIDELWTKHKIAENKIIYILFTENEVPRTLMDTPTKLLPFLRDNEEPVNEILENFEQLATSSNHKPKI